MPFQGRSTFSINIKYGFKGSLNVTFFKSCSTNPILKNIDVRMHNRDQIN